MSVRVRKRGIRSARAQGSRIADATSGRVDRDDRGLWFVGVVLPAHQNDFVPHADRGSVRYGLREITDFGHGRRRRIEEVDRGRGVRGGSGPADDHEPAVHRADCRIAESDREMRDDPRAGVGCVGDDGVEPVRAGVAADDVRRVTDGRGDRVGGLRRERAGGSRCAVRVDPQDRVELADAIAAPEQIQGVVEHGARGIVESCWQGRQGSHGRVSYRSDTRRRAPRRVESRGKDDLVTDCSGGGVGDGMAERRDR